MWKLFKKSNASSPLPPPLTVLNLWITPYISTAPWFFFYPNYKATELSFHLGCSIEHTIQFFNTIIWSENICKKICNAFFPFSALDLWASPHQALFHSFCDILSGKPLETLLKDQKIDQKMSPINDIINRSLNYLLNFCINQFF